MRRIQAACLLQTMHFLLKDDLEKEQAIKAVDEEVHHYKETLMRHQTKFQILSKTRQPDGSMILEVKKQYNTYPVGNYLDK